MFQTCESLVFVRQFLTSHADFYPCLTIVNSALEATARAQFSFPVQERSSPERSKSLYGTFYANIDQFSIQCYLPGLVSFPFAYFPAHELLPSWARQVGALMCHNDICFNASLSPQIVSMLLPHLSQVILTWALMSNSSGTIVITFVIIYYMYLTIV